jgi:hypothetical protein
MPEKPGPTEVNARDAIECLADLRDAVELNRRTQPVNIYHGEGNARLTALIEKADKLLAQDDAYYNWLSAENAKFAAEADEPTPAELDAEHGVPDSEREPFGCDTEREYQELVS